MSNPELPEVGRAHDIDHWVVLQNPGSTNASRVSYALEKLRKSPLYGPRLDFVGPRGKEDFALTHIRALSQLEEGSGLMLAGGDGTVHHTVNALLTDMDDFIRKVPVLALGAGHGNDIALSLNTRKQLNHLPRLLDEAAITPIRPLSSTQFSDDTMETRYAVAYMGFGATARGAQRFDSEAFRGQMLRKSLLSRWISDGVGVAKTMLEDDTYELINKKGSTRIWELSLANFPREAKYGRWPVKPEEPRFYLSYLEGYDLPQSVNWLGNLLVGNVPGLKDWRFAPRGTYIDEHGEVDFTVARNMPVHWDAETAVLSEGTHVQIKLAEQPYYAVTSATGVQYKHGRNDP